MAVVTLNDAGKIVIDGAAPITIRNAIRNRQDLAQDLETAVLAWAQSKATARLAELKAKDDAHAAALADRDAKLAAITAERDALGTKPEARAIMKAKRLADAQSRKAAADKEITAINAET